MRRIYASQSSSRDRRADWRRAPVHSATTKKSAKYFTQRQLQNAGKSSLQATCATLRSLLAKLNLHRAESADYLAYCVLHVLFYGGLVIIAVGAPGAWQHDLGPCVLCLFYSHWEQGVGANGARLCCLSGVAIAPWEPKIQPLVHGSSGIGALACAEGSPWALSGVVHIWGLIMQFGCSHSISSNAPRSREIPEVEIIRAHLWPWKGSVGVLIVAGLSVDGTLAHQPDGNWFQRLPFKMRSHGFGAQTTGCSAKTIHWRQPS